MSFYRVILYISIMRNSLIVLYFSDTFFIAVRLVLFELLQFVNVKGIHPLVYCCNIEYFCIRCLLLCDVEFYTSIFEYYLHISLPRGKSDNKDNLWTIFLLLYTCLTVLYCCVEIFVKLLHNQQFMAPHYPF